MQGRVNRGLGWTGLDWTGLDWAGLDWTGLDWTGLDSILFATLTLFSLFDYLLVQDCLGLVSVQLSLLRSASSLVRPGGVLVYSTCTIERRENRDVVMAFLESEQGRAFTLDAITTAAAAGAAGGVSADGMLELYPHKHGVDGAFAARMRRQRQDDDDEDD